MDFGRHTLPVTDADRPWPQSKTYASIRISRKMVYCFAYIESSTVRLRDALDFVGPLIRSPNNPTVQHDPKFYISCEQKLWLL